MTSEPDPAVSKLGSILSIWAHPDDESYFCAGIMCMARTNGQPVICVTATKGEAGVQDEARWPADQLAETRSQELAEALQIIGVREHHWLGYQDGHCSVVPDHEAVGRLKAIIKYYQPNTILTFGPDGMTGHLDHRTVSRWVSAAAQETSAVVYHAVIIKSCSEAFKAADEKFNIFFNIDQPLFIDDNEADLVVKLSEDCLNKKLTALRAMPSQTEALFETMSEDTIRKMVGVEAFVRADRQHSSP